MKKEKLEQHWEMLRWTIEYIENNKEVWEENKLEREKHQKEQEETERWSRLGDMEKRK